MGISTTCPMCSTSFRVHRDTLSMSDGQVACGNCQYSFNGLDYLRTLEGPSLDKPLLRSNTVLNTTEKKYHAALSLSGVSLIAICLIASLYFSWLPLPVVESLQSPLKTLGFELPPQDNIHSLRIVDTHFSHEHNAFKADVKIENTSTVLLKAPSMRITIQDAAYNVLFETSALPNNIAKLEPTTTSTMTFNLPKAPEGATYFKVQIRD